MHACRQAGIACSRAQRARLSSSCASSNFFFARKCSSKSSSLSSSSSKGTTAAQSAHKDTTAPRDTVEAITADKEETHAASAPATDSKRIRFGYKSKLMAFFKTIDTEDAGLAPRLDLRVGLQEKFPEETHPAVSPPKQRPKARIPLGRLMPSFASARSCRWPKHCITPTA